MSPPPPPAATTTVLARYPAALSLPTVDPNALAVEAMLHFAEVRYSRADARLRSLVLTIPSATSGSPVVAETSSPGAAKGKPEVCAGLMPCLKRLGSEGTVDSVPSAHAAAAVCVEALTTSCLFPAFLFITHFDPAIYTAVLRHNVEWKLVSFWEKMRGTHRGQILRANPFFYSGTAVAEVPQGQLSLTALAKLREVEVEVDKAFASLESLWTSTASAASEEGSVFFLGTARPTYVDALVYAAASSFMHSDVSKASASVRAHQRRVQEACPGLLQYVERMRRQFFEADSGTYNLKPRETAVEEDADMVLSSEAERQYRSGRLQTLWWTGLFASVYFVLVNADMFVALLEGVQEEDNEESVATEEGV